MQIEIVSDSASFTKNLGKKFSVILSKDNTVLFTGELGGGKTTFISGIAEGLGLEENLSSPSFTIINEYKIDNHKKFIHADLYRLVDAEGISGIGLDDYFYDGTSIVCVEWGDRIKDYIEKDYLQIDLSYLIDKSNVATRRNILFKSTSRYWDLKLAKFKKLF